MESGAGGGERPPERSRRRRRPRRPDMQRAEETFLSGIEEDEAAAPPAELEPEEPAIFGGEELLGEAGEEPEVVTYADSRPLPRPPGRGKRPPSPPKPRRSRGETLRRVLVAIPWIVFAITITVLGELPFTVALAVLGIIGLREFFAMTEEARPIAPAAYIALPAMVFAAHFGDSFQILLIGTSCFVLLFILGAQDHWREGVTISMGVTVLGLLWIGLPFVHAVLLRDLPFHGAALLIDVLVGTFATDTGAYAVGSSLRQPQDHAEPLTEQDPRGDDRRLRHRHDGLLVRRPLPGLALRDRRPDDGRRRRRPRPDGRPLRVDDQARPRRSRTRGPSSAPTAVCSTASTRSSSRSSPGTT